ncbi:hypothetical protein JG688_00009534, partial [Phytophthora aleatoria]
MFLLVQNEIGQIVGRRLTSSENKEETIHLLSDVKNQFTSTGGCYLISGDARAVSAFAATVYGDSVVVKQVPFHVIQRFSNHIKSKPLRKRICKELKCALYDVNRELRAPEKMEYNVAQIQAKQLHVAENTYNEGGGPPVRVVSTSQLEGFHSALKKLLAREVRVELGLRILDVFIVQHNIDVGARFGGNPKLGKLDLIAACRAAAVCKLYGNGLVASTTEQEFVNNLVSSSIPPHQYRSVTQHEF